jgi:hypothetical protein
MAEPVPLAGWLRYRKINLHRLPTLLRVNALKAVEQTYTAGVNLTYFRLDTQRYQEEPRRQ